MALECFQRGKSLKKFSRYSISYFSLKIKAEVFWENLSRRVDENLSIKFVRRLTLVRRIEIVMESSLAVKE
jgi:hypothetical protein